MQRCFIDFRCCCCCCGRRRRRRFCCRRRCSTQKASSDRNKPTDVCRSPRPPPPRAAPFCTLSASFSQMSVIGPTVSCRPRARSIIRPESSCMGPVRNFCRTYDRCTQSPTPPHGNATATDRTSSEMPRHSACARAEAAKRISSRTVEKTNKPKTKKRVGDVLLGERPRVQPTSDATRRNLCTFPTCVLATRVHPPFVCRSTLRDASEKDIGSQSSHRI
jgi:hypothetical protein